MWCRLRPDLRPEVVEKEEIHPVKSAFLAVLTPFFWSLSVAGLCKLHTTTSIFISERVSSVGAISSYQKPELTRNLPSQHLIMKFQTCTKVERILEQRSRLYKFSNILSYIYSSFNTSYFKAFQNKLWSIHLPSSTLEFIYREFNNCFFFYFFDVEFSHSAHIWTCAFFEFLKSSFTGL